MHAVRSIRLAGLALLLAFSALALGQANKAPTYEPQSGQEGKDVVWVPTPQILVDKMLDMAKVTPADFVMDLGSGDGRTVITMFLLPQINLKLRPKILGLKPGTRIVSNSFTMDDWEADEIATLTGDNGCNTSWCKALLWIVPARVAGTHKVAQGELALKQTFQMLTGTLTAGGKTFAIEGGKVRGEEISFKAGGRAYRGRMNGKSLELR